MATSTTTTEATRRNTRPQAAKIPPAPPSTPRKGVNTSPSPFSVSSMPRERDRSAAAVPRGSPRCAEVAGGTAASCAAVCCCCPCGILNLVLLALVGLPAGLCRKAIRRRKAMRRRKDNKSFVPRDGDEGSAAGMVTGGTAAAMAAAEVVPSEEMAEMDKEMKKLFYGTGFWRSPSQREN